MASGITTTAVAVGTSATLLLAADGQRGTVWIQNHSNADMFIGGASVTADNGLTIPAGESRPFYRSDGDLTACEAIYGVASSAQSSPNDTRVLVGRGK